MKRYGSSLYPGFGSGKGTYDVVLEARSFEKAGMFQSACTKLPTLWPLDELFNIIIFNTGKTGMEAGDKVFLPPSSFKKIQQMRLPFPLTFQVKRDRQLVAAKPGAPPPTSPLEQYAGVYEFSAPEGVALLPKWMMGNLKLREGSKVSFTTVRDLPKGQFVRLRSVLLRFFNFLSTAHCARLICVIFECVLHCSYLLFDSLPYALSLSFVDPIQSHLRKLQLLLVQEIY